MLSQNQINKFDLDHCEINDLHIVSYWLQFYTDFLAVKPTEFDKPGIWIDMNGIALGKFS